ncbi:MAG: ParB N-terminal domain-containing protein, partial [Bacteroidales bacterium]|nr:ParB N-terminal domain-containing protein [Bacteroidales bacterium]
TPDPDNAKDHPAWQVDQIKASIEQFGNLDPIGVWGPQNLIVEGHGRYEALKELGYQEAEVIRLDQLTDEERRAYALAHNQTTLTSGFDPDLLKLNLDSIGEIDMSLFGFRTGDWFTDRERNDTSRQEGNDEYNEFLDKFEQPKTTDDCYTPDNIYEVVADFVEEKYKASADNFVRPFYPGGDYQAQHYKKTDIVVDNPPFSILAEIVDFYIENGVRFFLFAPALAALNYAKRDTVAAICLNASVTYENGASVSTSFITNMEPPEIIAYTDPDFAGRIDEVNDINEKAMRKSLPKYDYPYEVLTSAKMGWLTKYGQKLTYKRTDAIFIRALDAQKEQGVGIYGGALLLSERAAAERAAAERAAAERAAAERAAATVWKLSDRELEIVKGLGEHHGKD